MAVGVIIFNFNSQKKEIDQSILGHYKVDNDTFTLSNEILNYLLLNKIDILGGHEMVIYGYDDNACYTYKDNLLDKKFQRNCGLLLLRNSWGSDAGDHGNYYMSYNYFINSVLELYAVKS